MSLKALAERVLHGNQQGNLRETESFLIPKNEGAKTPPKETEFPDTATPDELFLMIGKALALIDRGGRPWDNWRRSLTEPQRQALRAVEQRIDLACLTLDRPGLIAALDEYRQLTSREKNPNKSEAL